MRYFLLITVILIGSFLQAQDIGDLKNQKPFTINGSVNLRGIFNSTSGIPSKDPAAAFVATGSLTPALYGITFPLSFSYSNDGSKNFAQPFNRFGISPTYKWATVHFGYRNINYQPYTMSGHSINGIGFDLTPGKLRASFIYGRLNKATTIDTLTQSLVDASYTRKGYAAKVGYGTNDNFAELSFLTAKDDTSSLLFNKKAYETKADYPALFAAQNATAGFSHKITVLKKLVWESDAALSVYVNNMQSTQKADTLLGAVYNMISKTIAVNATAQYGMALQTAIGYKEKNYSVKLKYQRIDPKFNSMGTYYLQTDLENYTIAPSAVFLKNRIRVSGSFGIQHDNLNKQKTASSKRFIGSANGSAEINPNFGFDFNFSNYNTSQAPTATRIKDTLRITQATYNIGVTPRYITGNERMGHVVMLSLQQSILNDFNTAYTVGSQSRTMNTLNAILNYQLQFNKSGASTGISLNYTKLHSEMVQEKNYGITLTAGKPFLQNKLTANVSGSYLLNKQENTEGNIINGSLQANYLFYKTHSFGITTFYINNAPKAASAAMPSYSKLRGELSYNYRF